MAGYSGVTIGARVEAYRLLNRLSRDELAAKTGVQVGRDVIANIENGRRKDITVSQLVSLADALGVPATALMFDVTRPLAAVSDLKVLEELRVDQSGESRVTRSMTLADALIWMSQPSTLSDRIEGVSAAGEVVARQIFTWRRYLIVMRRVESLLRLHYESIDALLAEPDDNKRLTNADTISDAWALYGAAIQAEVDVPQPSVPESSADALRETPGARAMIRQDLRAQLVHLDTEIEMLTHRRAELLHQIMAIESGDDGER